MTTVDATLTLNADQRRKLSVVYRYLLSLSERRKAKGSENTTPARILMGTMVGVAEDSDKRQSPGLLYPGLPHDASGDTHGISKQYSTAHRP